MTSRVRVMCLCVSLFTQLALLLTVLENNELCISTVMSPQRHSLVPWFSHARTHTHTIYRNTVFTAISLMQHFYNFWGFFFTVRTDKCVSQIHSKVKGRCLLYWHAASHRGWAQANGLLRTRWKTSIVQSFLRRFIFYFRRCWLVPVRKTKKKHGLLTRKGPRRTARLLSADRKATAIRIITLYERGVLKSISTNVRSLHFQSCMSRTVREMYLNVRYTVSWCHVPLCVLAGNSGTPDRYKGWWCNAVTSLTPPSLTLRCSEGV